MMKAGRERKVPLEGRLLGLTVNWVQVEGGKGGQLDGGRHRPGSHEELVWAIYQGR